MSLGIDFPALVDRLVEAGYLPPECLLHLVREARSDNSDDHFAALYRQLRRRVLG